MKLTSSLPAREIFSFLKTLVSKSRGADETLAAEVEAGVATAEN